MLLVFNRLRVAGKHLFIRDTFNLSRMLSHIKFMHHGQTSVFSLHAVTVLALARNNGTPKRKDIPQLTQQHRKPSSALRRLSLWEYELETTLKIYPQILGKHIQYELAC